MRTARHPAAS